jgi:mycofactocin system glycosyltransferase
MSTLVPLAPVPIEWLIAKGTSVIFDGRVEFIDDEYVSGGSPWRLLRLAGRSREVADRWHYGGTVEAGEERLARTLVVQGLLHPRFNEVLNRDDIDVIVPCYNASSALAALLAQLKGFHVTVVDDGSTEEEKVAQLCHNFGATAIRLNENFGPAHARNVGASSTRRKLLWFIDVDILISDATSVAQELASTFVDPMVAVVAPRVRGPNVDSLRGRFEHRFGPLDMGEYSGLVVPGGATGYLPSASMMVRRDSFGEGFDETLRVGEDVDLVWRLHDAGWLIRYNAQVDVEHPARDSWKAWLLQRERYGASAGELAKRHGSRLAPLRSDPWTLVMWLTALIGKPALGFRIVRAAQNDAKEKLFRNAKDPSGVAREVVGRNMFRAGGPLARAVVRTFGILLLIAALHPRLRKRALILFGVGTAWRWRHNRPLVSDIPLGIADDMAYGVGVLHGAVRSKTMVPLIPRITKSSLTVRSVLGLSSRVVIRDE